MKKKLKTARIEIRCRPEDKARLERLATADDMSLGNYMVATCLDAAAIVAESRRRRKPSANEMILTALKARGMK